MPANYVLLQRIELNASAASVTFSNIPQSGYTDLLIKISARDSDTSGALTQVSFNGVTTNLSSRRLRGTGSAATSTAFASNIYTQGQANGDTANTFGNSEIYIPNYTSSNYKSVSEDGVSENNATAAYMQLTAGLWSSTAAITSVTLTSAAGPYLQYSTFSLYGLAAVGTTPVIAPKATGGSITSDGTYWIHTFRTTGTFTPLQGLSCDALVVAGGGGGTGISAGGGAGGPGGGAGGFRTTTGLSVSAQAYTITVGAGGAGGIGSGAVSSGTDSIFSTITSTGGGAGGNNNGVSGGSGGGARYNGTVGAGNTPSTSPSQGSNGGLGGGALTWQGGGGGGGASAVGTAGTGSNSNVAIFGGNGGAGTSNSYSGSSVTYAGGGGGGVYADPPSASAAGTGGSGGGGNGGWEANGSNGTVNTGGGGGGTGRKTGTAYNGGTGGSGIVIIRYPIA